VIAQYGRLCRTRPRFLQSREDRTDSVRIQSESLSDRCCLPRTVVVVVEEQHDPFGIIPVFEFVGIGVLELVDIGVLELVDIDSATRYGLLLEMLGNSHLGCLLLWIVIHHTEKCGIELFRRHRDEVLLEVVRPVRREPPSSTRRLALTSLRPRTPGAECASSRGALPNWAATHILVPKGQTVSCSP